MGPTKKFVFVKALAWALLSLMLLLILFAALVSYRITGTVTGPTPYILCLMYWFTFVSPIKFIVVMCFSIGVLIACGAFVSLLSQTTQQLLGDSEKSSF